MDATSHISSGHDAPGISEEERADTEQDERQSCGMTEVILSRFESFFGA